jgi:L-ascorbate metabolism protein UlaG (beta-lactamase superfamily)
MKIQRLSWAGIKIESGDTTVLVDATSRPEDGDLHLNVTTPTIHALISHHHSDHFDSEALGEVFQPKSTLTLHTDVLHWLGRHTLPIKTTQLFEPNILDSITGQVVAFAVPAADGLGHPQVSWVIDVAGQRIIHCGDTLWHGRWWKIARAYGPFDIAFMPINGARQILGMYSDSGFPMVMTPEQAVSAAKILGAKQVCPIHYGGHTPPVYLEESDCEARFLQAAKEKQLEVKLLQPGEWLELS